MGQREGRDEQHLPVAICVGKVTLWIYPGGVGGWRNCRKLTKARLHSEA